MVRSIKLDIMVRESCRYDASSSYVGCWMLDVGCWMLDVGGWMLDVGCWMLHDVEWYMSTFGV